MNSFSSLIDQEASKPMPAVDEIILMRLNDARRICQLYRYLCEAAMTARCHARACLAYLSPWLAEDNV